VLAGQVDLVQRRYQGFDHLGDRELPGDEPVPIDALAVVDVLGLEPLQVSEVLGGLGLGRGHVERPVGRADVERPLGRADVDAARVSGRRGSREGRCRGVVPVRELLADLARLRVELAAVPDHRAGGVDVAGPTVRTRELIGHLFSSSSTISASTTSSSEAGLPASGAGDSAAALSAAPAA